LQRVPEQDWKRAFPWQSLRAAQAHVVFGSDFPVASLNPWEGIAFALTRRTLRPDHPDQRQTLQDALRAYTAGAAYVEFREAHKGRLEAGMAADVVLLDRDLLLTDAEDIAATNVLMTVCDGRVTHEL
jgi:hypothetical protein